MGGRLRGPAVQCDCRIGAVETVGTNSVDFVRAVAAIDSGEIVNPDGIRNQTEGGIIQSTSWTLYETVTFDETRITSVDWSTYPIMRFRAVPETVEVHVVERPGEPFLEQARPHKDPSQGR